MSFPARWSEPHWKPAKTGPKPRSRIRPKRKPKAERDQIEIVRRACVDRDGYCRGQGEGYVHTCEGPSEWAHLHRKRRSKTRNEAPEVRHTTIDSCMLCRALHRAYDAHKVDIEVGGHGCNGPMRFCAR